MIGIVDPVARVYRFITPEFLRTGIRKFGTNLAYPKHLLNSLLQGKWKGAGNETLRFLTNTSVGFVGFFDPATHWGMEPSRERFGRTLGKWGWKHKVYMMFPLFGPNSGREAVGALGDTFTTPQSYLFPASQILTFNDLSGQVDQYKHFTRTQYDPYTLGKYIWTILRSEKDPYYESEYDNDDELAIQTLHTIFFAPRDPRFAARSKTRSVPLSSTGKTLPYNIWMQPEPAPLLFILPGLGGHRDSASARALAEMAYGRGFSAVTISSAMNWEFMERGSTVAVPGFALVDARDVHTALDAIYRNVASRYPDRITSRALMGISLGAFHTLFIAAAEEKPSNKLVRFDRYVAIAPPVQLFHGVEQLDGFYNAPLAFPPEERDERVENTLLKILHLRDKELKPGMEIPFNRIEAEFIIGLAFRLTLHDIIHSSQTRHDMGVLKTQLTGFRRANAYREILEFSYMEYFYGFVLPYFQEKTARIRRDVDMIRFSDLRSLERSLARNGKIRVFPTRNDFLYSPDDISWLSRVFGDGRLHFFEDGGHLGNLYREDVQERIMQSFVDLVPGE